MFMEKKKARKSAEKRVNARRIKKATEGLVSNVVDFLLYTFLLLPASSFGKHATSSGVYKTFAEADLLQKDINYQSFKNAFRKLREKGLINRIEDWTTKQIATQEGIKRLNSIVPFYDEERFWDGNLYLIQYDVPRKNNYIRNTLRDFFLKKLRAVKLQQSLYLIFYNPQELLKKFLKNKSDFEGNILISKLTKDGILGEDLKQFLWKQSGLTELNQKYRDFIDKYTKNHTFPRGEIFKDYFSILEKDPQIPFALLPDEYLGDEAYLLFQKQFNNTLFYMHVHKK